MYDKVIHYFVFMNGKRILFIRPAFGAYGRRFIDCSGHARGSLYVFMFNREEYMRIPTRVKYERSYFAQFQF